LIVKRLITYILALLLAGSLTVPALGAYDPEENYMDRMLDAVTAGDAAAGEAAERQRNEKIEAQNSGHIPIRFEDLLLLSQIMYAEAGSYWLGDEWKLYVGEVVLNRVASTEFPDTIREVLEQPGQYYGKDNPYFSGLRPDRRCAELALRLLEGERHMEASVVFQANFRQGSGTYLALCDSRLGWTYFCYSLRPELYQI
jgi:hypothetical protein